MVAEVCRPRAERLEPPDRRDRGIAKVVGTDVRGSGYFDERQENCLARAKRERAPTVGHDGVALAAVVAEGLILCWLSWAVATTRGRGGLLFGLVLAGAIWGISVGFARVTAPIP